MRDQEVVKRKWPDAEVSWGRFGAKILSPIKPQPTSFWAARYVYLNAGVTFALASEAWADAAKRLTEEFAVVDRSIRPY